MTSSSSYDKKILLQHSDNNIKIQDRVLFIKHLLESTGIEPIIDLKEGMNYTECFHSSIDKKTFVFTDVISKIGGKLKYIKSGSTGHTFQGIYYPDPNDSTKSISYAVKVVAYMKDDDIEESISEATRPENVELQILKILSQLVLSNYTPHVVLPIATFNTYIDTFINLKEKKIVQNKRYDKFVTLYEKKKIHNTVSILISEWINGGDLLEYLNKNLNIMTAKEWRILLFQIIAVLAIIQKKYPAFRHNDAKANNWLLQKIDITKLDNKFFKYIINGMDFLVPNIGYQIKLWDFDFACIQGIAENSKVNSEYFNNMNISNKPNRYYDLCFFICSLQKPGFIEHFRDSKNVPQEVFNFIDSIVPPELTNSKLINERGRLLSDIEYTTPAEILATHPYFNKLRKDNKMMENSYQPIGKNQLYKILNEL